jgi:light-regulated signal transduction histidine kinase (bacteriophytochrome)
MRPTNARTPVSPASALEAEIARLRARACELEREKAELAAFAAVAAHEPLVMTEAYAMLLCDRLDARLHAASRRDLDVLGRDAARVRVLVEALLYDACVGERPPWRRVDLAAVVHDCVRALAPEIEARGARVEVERLPRVLGDARLLAIVFSALLVTALRCGQPGGRIRPRATRRAGLRSIVLITDGLALPVEERLELCRHLARRHGGEVGVSGDRLLFTLPRGRGDRSPPAQSASGRP